MTHNKSTILVSSIVAAAAATAAVSGFVGVDGFAIPPAVSSSCQRQSSLSAPWRLNLSDQPSDTSSDPYYEQMGDETDDDVVVTVDSEDFVPSDNDVLVTSILDLIPVSLASSTMSDEKRAEINEAILKLEALNPTPQPAYSPLLNGIWELKYAGNYATQGAVMSPTRQIALFVYSGGYSPAMFALELAQKLPKFLFDFDEDSGLEITISRNQPRVEGSVRLKVLGGEPQTVSVKCRMETLSDIRIREVYESATVLSNEVEIPSMLQYTRDMYVTYVDEDILVIRDGSGVPELLVRKEKTFTRNWGTDP
eukprot:CAMPEP_0113444704 /NCGR_PEP_ID=MMETSP0014_2-20120614/2805_1 /TAXON_ID=2857 /ORGANISM="Nitzschia sp." /LENGTH=308 /DNA_ID=CAMNT_0000335727 /DNA_START=149 /DNA_END=1075 /DNA_ORIENTATION=- /assembly_acc=CAM_ASM_000159